MMSFIRAAAIFLATSGLLWGALKTVALFVQWPAIGYWECGVLLALSWISYAAYELISNPEKP